MTSPSSCSLSSLPLTAVVVGRRGIVGRREGVVCGSKVWWAGVGRIALVWDPLGRS
jgi:hypothetical protein